MSSFSSTLGVVAPALFPIVPNLAQTTGIEPSVLFTLIILGAQASSISPFSSGGSLILGTVPEEKKDELFGALLFKAMPICLGAGVVTAIILGIIL